MKGLNFFNDYLFCMSIFLSTAYLGNIQYYSKFFLNEDIYIEQEESYLKQSYRNRCSILSANGKIDLSIPIESSGGLKSLIKDIRISEHGNWQHLHWNAIISAYNSTPFFEYYRDDFEPFYRKKYHYLFDFNEELRNTIFSLLDMSDLKVNYTSSYKKECDGVDLRNQISPKIDWILSDRSFCIVPYYQVFEDRFRFVPNLSIIDLLFNMGNESLIILQNSIKKPLE